MASPVLDADMATVGRWLGEGWRWWLAELDAMLPMIVRRRPRGSARGPVAWFERGRPFAFTRDGRPAALATGTAVTIALPPSLCLLRTIEIQALADDDARRLVTLQLDRLMPFPPGAALYDVTFGPAAGSPRREATVAALPVETAGEIARAVTETTLAPRAIRVAMPDGSLAFDFLPALRAARGEPDPAAGRRAWWRLAAALFALNLVLLVATDILALRNEERVVQAHADGAMLARTARARVAAEQDRRRRLVARRAAYDPAALLARLTHALPPGAWVQRLSMDGGTVRIVGVRRDADVIGPLRAGNHFLNVRNTSADVLAATPEGQPFDVSFDLPGPGQ